MHWAVGGLFVDDKKYTLIHIPIRHPYDVARSWATRGRELNQFRPNYDVMFKWMEDNPGRFEIHHTEPLENLTPPGESFKPDDQRFYDPEPFLAAVALVVAAHREFFLPFNYKF